jgi:hypothetical protein
LDPLEELYFLVGGSSEGSERINPVMLKIRVRREEMRGESERE